MVVPTANTGTPNTVVYFGNWVTGLVFRGQVTIVPLAAVVVEDIAAVVVEDTDVVEVEEEEETEEVAAMEETPEAQVAGP